MADYTPPYGSPIEDAFARHFVPLAAASLKLTPQFKVETCCGPFFLDFFAVTDSGFRVGIECDGKEFHADAYRDEWRSAMIFGAGKVDVIYRFRGQDIIYHLRDLMFALSVAEPVLFSLDGRTKTRSAAYARIRSSLPIEEGANSIPRSETFIKLSVDSSTEETDQAHILLSRMFREMPLNPKPFWTRYYEFTLSTGLRSLDEAIALWKAEHNLVGRS